jgi:hypothetical protein
MLTKQESLTFLSFPAENDVAKTCRPFSSHSAATSFWEADCPVQFGNSEFST